MANFDEDFGALPDGRGIARATIGQGPLRVGLLTLGAIVQDVRLHGRPMCLGATEAAPYAGLMGHFGAVMGPVANRIRNARAEIDGTEYRFPANQDGRHTLHGGEAGTHHALWSPIHRDADRVTLALDLTDGDGGFPGNRHLEADYVVKGQSLTVTLTATTDAPTLISLALHGYWALGPAQGWAGQRLRVAADRYLPTDDDTIPTGEIAPVDGTRFDFREGRVLEPGGAMIDHNLCLADGPRPLMPVLWLDDPSGVSLTLSTTAPGIQVFDMSKFGIDTDATVHGHPYPKHAALALEPQHWPDAPGRDAWPSIRLDPGETWRQITRYDFAMP